MHLFRVALESSRLFSFRFEGIKVEGCAHPAFVNVDNITVSCCEMYKQHIKNATFDSVVYILNRDLIA